MLRQPAQAVFVILKPIHRIAAEADQYGVVVKWKWESQYPEMWVRLDTIKAITFHEENIAVLDCELSHGTISRIFLWTADASKLLATLTGGTSGD